ncbi:hypothetical protein AO367_0267 [Moraxella catarrhalis]|nr:hypothetical protein AO367_0267 [Moraxella catarrhalis]
MAMGEHGLDVTYVITGNHTLPAQYSEQDIAIADSIKKLDPIIRNFIMKGLEL